MDSSITIRAAREADTEYIYSMIRELAEFEQLTSDVVSTADSIREALFCEQPAAEALIVEDNGVAIAFALFFQNFSTFVGRQGLYLEDVYVRPSHRRKGIGKALILELAKIAKQRGCGRFEWCVLDWNKNAIEFYEGLGANVLQDWRIVRLDSEGIEKLVLHPS